MNKKLFIFFLLSLFYLQSQASISDSTANEIFTLIYQQNLEAAENQLNSEKEQLDKFYYLLLNLDLHWWKYRTINTKHDSKKLEDLFYLPDTRKETKWQKVKQLLTISYKIRFQKTKLNFIGMFSSRSEIKEIIDQIKPVELSLNGEQIELIEAYIIMFQYIENINFLNSRNNSDQRKELLNRMKEFSTRDNEMLSTIACFFLARMYQKVEKETKTGLSYYKILTTRYTTNKTFEKYQKECEDKL